MTLAAAAAAFGFPPGRPSVSQIPGREFEAQDPPPPYQDWVREYTIYSGPDPGWIRLPYGNNPDERHIQDRGILQDALYDVRYQQAIRWAHIDNLDMRIDSRYNGQSDHAPPLGSDYDHLRHLMTNSQQNFERE